MNRDQWDFIHLVIGAPAALVIAYLLGGGVGIIILLLAAILITVLCADPKGY